MISAYLDGELDPTESRLAERDVGENADSQQELDESKQLSELIQALPQFELNESFAAEVMQSAERSMLLDGEPTRPARSRLFVIASAVASVAAAIIVLPFWFRANTSPESVATTAAPQASFSEVEDFDEAPEEAASADVAMAISEPAGLEMPMRSQLLFDENLSSAQVGEVIEALDTSQGEIAVVRLTVVDRIQGLEKLQVLLAKNQIANADQPTEPAKDNSAAEEEMMAVFVEADSSQLSQALAQLKNESLFQELQVESNLNIASLDTKSQQLFLQSDSAGFGVASKENTDSKEEKAKPRATPPAPAVVSAERQLGNVNQRQVRMAIPKRYLAARDQLVATRATNQPAANAGEGSLPGGALPNQAKIAGGGVAGGGVAGKPRRGSTRAVQLLIVLVEDQSKTQPNDDQGEDGSGAA